MKEINEEEKTERERGGGSIFFLSLSWYVCDATVLLKFLSSLVLKREEIYCNTETGARKLELYHYVTNSPKLYHETGYLLPKRTAGAFVGLSILKGIWQYRLDD